MREAALPGRAREALLDRADDAGSAVRDDEQRVAETTAAHILEEGRTVSVSSFEPAIRDSSTLRPSVADAPGRQNRLACSRLAPAAPKPEVAEVIQTLTLRCFRPTHSSAWVGAKLL